VRGVHPGDWLGWTPVGRPRQRLWACPNCSAVVHDGERIIPFTLRDEGRSHIRAHEAWHRHAEAPTPGAGP
jgi:hypothetical protein